MLTLVVLVNINQGECYMATKREVVAQLTTDDIKLLAEAAAIGAKKANFNAKDLKRVKRGVELLRTVRAAQ